MRPLDSATRVSSTPVLVGARAASVLVVAWLALGINLISPQPLRLRSDGQGGQGLICLLPNGSQSPQWLRCQGDEGFHHLQCACPTGSEPVRVDLCGNHERPIAETSEVKQARVAAVQSGSLVGVSIKGQRVCFRPARRPTQNSVSMNNFMYDAPAATFIGPN